MGSNWPKEEDRHSEGVVPPVQHSEGLDPPVQAGQWGSRDPPAHARQWRHGPTCLGLPQSGEQPPLWTRRLEKLQLSRGLKKCAVPSLKFVDVAWQELVGTGDKQLADIGIHKANSTIRPTSAAYFGFQGPTPQCSHPGKVTA